MKITTKKINFNGWNCVEVSDGTVSAIVTTDVGPRIISYGFTGGFNHMAVFKKGGDKITDGYNNYGGHRLWHAPEHKERTYLGDNSKVKTETIDDGAIFTQKEEPTGIVKKLRLEFLDDNKLGVSHIFVNNSAFPVKAALWGLTQFMTGGMLAVPNTELDTGLLANRAVSLWPYSAMNDERVYWGNKYITVKATDKSAPFKFGTTCDMEYAGYFNNNELVIKHFPYVRGAEYPNYNCNFESYCCGEFIEIESLSPLDTMPEYGGDMEMEEIWEIYKDVPTPAASDEKALAEIFDKYIGDFSDCDCDDDCDGGCNGDCDCGECSH